MKKTSSVMMLETLLDIGNKNFETGCQAMKGGQPIVHEVEPGNPLNSRKFIRSNTGNTPETFNDQNVIGDGLDHYAMGGKRVSSKSVKEYVFVIMVNSDTATSQTSCNSESNVEDFSDVLDISSAMFDDRLDSATVESICFSTNKLKKVVSKVIENISKKDESECLADVIDDPRSQFFLVTNCSVPFSIVGRSKSFPSRRNLRARKETKMVSKFTQVEFSKSTQFYEASAMRQTSEEPIIVKPDISEYLGCDMNFSDFLPNKHHLEMTETASGNTSKENENPEGRYKCEKCNQFYKTHVWLMRHQRYSCKGGVRVSKVRDPPVKRRKRIVRRKRDETDSDNEIDNEDSVDEILKYSAPSKVKSDGPSHPCKKCLQTFRTKRLLNAHIRRVCKPKLKLPEKQAVVCEFCGKECPNRSSLYQHLHGHRNLRQHKCPECGKGFSRTQTRNTHVQNVHRKAKEWFYCTKCGIRSLSRKHILAHEQIHNLPEGAAIPTPFECECGKAFISQYKLTIHRNYHHKVRKCDVCHSMFTSKPAMSEHKRLCHNVNYKSGQVGKIYKCPACPKELSSVSSLNFHIHNLHSIYNPTKDKAIKCDKCAAGFVMFGTYINHKRETHREDVSLSDLQALTETLVAAVMETPGSSLEQGETCDWCAKKFNTKRALYNHKYKVHQAVGATDVGCKECDRKFNNRISYYNHYNRVHKKSECFCKECDLPFANKREYYAHKYSVHTPAQHRTCEICHKEFKDKISLWNHKYAHAPASHVCPECGSKFKRKPDLNRHMRDKHGAPPATANRATVAPFPLN